MKKGSLRRRTYGTRLYARPLGSSLLGVCVYVCMYVRTYVCTYVRMYACMYVRLYARTYVRTYVRSLGRIGRFGRLG